MAFKITDDNSYITKLLYPSGSNKATFWCPTPAQLKNIMTELFNPSRNFFSDIGRLLFNADPQKALISLRVYPLDFSGNTSWVQDMTETADFTIMSKGVPTSEAPYSTKRIKQETLGRLIDFGYLDVPYLYGNDNFLNYDPYSKIYLYLPFAPLTPLDTKIVVGKRIYISGVLDFYAGDMHYFVSYSSDEGVTKTFLDEIVARVAVDIPIYASNTFDQMSNVVKGAITNLATAGFGLVSGSPKMVAQAGISAINNALEINLENRLQKTGSMGTMGSFYCPLKPHLLRYTPRTKYEFDNTHYNHLYGVPCKKIDKLNTFGGFTKVGGVHIKEIPNATTEEVAEIESLLKEGILLENTQAIFGINYSYNSTQVSFSNLQVSVPFGATYTTNVNVVSGYQIDEIKVFMSGQDITSTAVTGNTISVANVSGNLSIRITSSVVPVYYTISYTNLTGATLSNTQTSILQGTAYTTTITPDYANSYYIGSYVPAVYMGGASVTTGVEGGSISIPNVQGNITIGGIYPSVTTLVGTWSMRENFIDLPDDPIVFTNVHLAFNDGTDSYECTDCVIDNQPDLNGYFITFTTLLNQSIAISQTGAIYVDDVYTSQLASITFNESSEYYSSYSGLLEWLDTNFIKT